MSATSLFFLPVVVMATTLNGKYQSDACVGSCESFWSSSSREAMFRGDTINHLCLFHFVLIALIQEIRLQ